MSTPGTLDALRALHGELFAVCQHRFENLQVLEQALSAHTEAFKKLLDKPSREQKSRDAVRSGKIKVDEEEYKINEEFVESTLRLADEIELDEMEAAKILLGVEDDPEVPGNSLLEKGLIRFHLQREYLLNCMRLCIQISNDEDLESALHDAFAEVVDSAVFAAPEPGQPATGKRIVPKCLDAMRDIKAWIQKIQDKITAISMMDQAAQAQTLEFQEAIEFSRRALVTQHEILAVIMCAAIEKRYADTQDFKDFFAMLKKVDRYDQLLVHLFPSLGAYISVFGSTEGRGDFELARSLNTVVCNQGDDETWTLIYLRAAVRAWWIAEYSGWYLDGEVPENVNLDKEDAERSKQFLDSLKDGAFDFIMSVAADCKTVDWQDPARFGMREWLQRKSPAFPPESQPFHEFFRQSMMVQLEVFIDAAISNIPDVLRKLRTEEDEQRQLRETHEQDLDLERFLIIISYAYEDRPDAAMSFWEDPDSNLAGFLSWASKRASTPLVSAFCEMIQCLADSEECATAAHNFLLDDGVQATGKLKRTQSLTWRQIFRELQFFTVKLREKTPTQQATTYRAGKPVTDQAETEPESATMLECYLRLMAKLSTQSAVARNYLFRDSFNLVDICFQLAAASVPPRLRACIFHLLKALLKDKEPVVSYAMWDHYDKWSNGNYLPQHSLRTTSVGQLQEPNSLMNMIFREVSDGFEEPNAVIQFLTALVSPVANPDGLNDGLAFPETLGALTRSAPGIEPYVEYVFDKVFAVKSRDTLDPNPLRALRVSCLEFALTCLNTFNEDLIVLGNQSNIAIDAAIEATDLATYVRLHPFANVMEWMFNDNVLKVLFDIIHQNRVEVSQAPYDSPLITSIHLAVRVMLKVLELQATYFDLVRPAIKMQGGHREKPIANAAYASFEDGLMSQLDLVVDLSRWCCIGFPPLTLSCLKMLEKISISQKILAAWNPATGRHGNRNKAIVALERNGEADAVAGSLSVELVGTLDPGLEDTDDNYVIKLFILDFLYECLKASPDRPTIAHQILGFRCEHISLSIDPHGAFEDQKSLFHSLLNVFLEVPYFDEDKGMRRWLISLKYQILRIFQVLWNSPLSSALVMQELRATKFLFHSLLRGVSIGQLKWDGEEAGEPGFLLTDASVGYIEFLAIRAMLMEYTGKELCSVSQTRLPAVKREIFEALNGKITADDGSAVSVPNVFDLFDFLLPIDDQPALNVQLDFYKDLDLSVCSEEDPDVGIQYDAHKVKELLALKRNEGRNAGQIISEAQFATMEAEEALLLEYIVFANRQRQLYASRVKVLRSWTNLILIMFESSEIKGTAQVSFLLQALQAILPSLERFSLESPAEALELAKLAKVLLFKLDFSPDATVGLDGQGLAMGALVSDKLFQLFQVCLNAISKWKGDAELRAVYYSICYRYLTSIVERDTTGSGQDPSTRDRAKAIGAIVNYGDRLLNVVCDDAYGSDAMCQTAAMVLLGALVHVSRSDDAAQVIVTLNRLNFIGVLVDSLRTVLADWLAAASSSADEPEQQQQYIAAKLALLLQLCQTRPGAKYAIQANLFRALELSGAFAADPELVDADAAGEASRAQALARHYALLAGLARIVAAAVLARGQHSVPQGRRFLAQYRLLVVHALKRSAGIGGAQSAAKHVHASESVLAAAAATAAGWSERVLEESVQDLAEAFMVLITATGFLEFETDQTPVEKPRPAPTFFH